MDGKKRAARTEEMMAAAARADDAAPSPVRKAPLPDDAAVDYDEPTVTAAEESGGAGGVEDDEDDDDEQVEKFYALLANIRALRGLLPPPNVAPSSSYGGGNGNGGTGASSRKRLRAAEPPWRPAFRMEDFEEPAAAPAPLLPSKRKHTEGGGDAEAESASGAHPVVAPSLPHAAVARSDSGGSCNN